MINGSSAAAASKPFFERVGVPLGLQTYTLGEEPNRANYAFTCEHASQTPGDLYNSTFDQLGRRYFVSMTMDF